MSVVCAKLQECEAGLAVSPSPVWVADVQTLAVLWANPPALELWRASSLEELYHRDLITGAPERVLARLRNVIARVLAGEVLCEEWTFYPRGEPTTWLLHLRKISLPDGSDAMLNQAMPLAVEASPSVMRALVAMRHLSTPVAYVGEAGDLRMQNPAAMAEFGETTTTGTTGTTGTWPAWFVDPAQAWRILRAAHAGAHVHEEARVRGQQGERWHVIEAHPLRDPVLGDLGVLALHRDETARLAAQQSAAEQLRVVEAQRLEILALAAPILVVGADTLALPIIGRLDAARSGEIMERLLLTITERRARRVILDLTGVVEMDEVGVGRLVALFAAIRLLGAAPVLTGVRPALAELLAQSELARGRGQLQILRSLADALA